MNTIANTRNEQLSALNEGLRGDIIRLVDEQQKLKDEGLQANLWLSQLNMDNQALRLEISRVTSPANNILIDNVLYCTVKC
jgi:hypothetical protein